MLFITEFAPRLEIGAKWTLKAYPLAYCSWWSLFFETCQVHRCGLAQRKRRVHSPCERETKRGLSDLTKTLASAAKKPA